MSIEKLEEHRERTTALEWEEHSARAQEPVQDDYAVLATYTLQVIGPEGWPGFPAPLGVIDAALRESEENVSDLLPNGYSVLIREWDSEEES